MSSLKLTSVYICVNFLSLIAVVHCTYVLHPEIHGYVKQHKEVATWDEAKKHCENEGAILASPVNAQVLKYMKSVITTNNHTTPYFIGIKSKLDKKASFLSQEGILLEDMPEALDLVEQLDSRNGDCLCMDGDSIRVVQCWTRLPYICYRRNVTEEDVTTTETPTTMGTTEDCNTGSYYKFYDESHAANWEEANSTCVADGGYLAIINTPTEARMIKYIVNRQSANTRNWRIYIGIREQNPHSLRDPGINRWFSVHGDPIKNLFSSFDSMKLGGSCGALGYRGWLEQHSCDDKLPFVCEKNHLDLCLG